MSDLGYIAALEIILPPGSTSADLREAINSAASGDTIILSGDMPFTETVTIPYGKEITIQSDEGNNRVMLQSNAGMRHFSIFGTLILKDITLDGMSVGGGIMANGGIISTNEGAAIKNCRTSLNGGAIHLTNSHLVMDGGIISGNSAGSNGGGIYLSNSDFTMSDGEISNNTAASSGGGIYLSDASLLVIYEGIVTRNTSNYGGGIYITDSILSADAGIINGNIAYYGGGIYIRLSNYSILETGVNIVFSCNRAENAYEPPADAGTLYPNIQFASTTIANHPLNNYDINYATGVIIDPSCHVIYNANGGVGSHIGPGVEPCDTDAVLSDLDTGISRYGYTFADWNTIANGTGTSYAPEAEITVSEDIILYAQWTANLYKVEYDSNGGNGGYEEYIPYDTLYTVLSVRVTGISRMMYAFSGWNTRPDGTGVSYIKGDSFVISGELTLYAQWEKITRRNAVNLMLVSVAMDKLAVAHILNNEGEKLQYILGISGEDVTPCDIIEVSEHIQKTLREAVEIELLSQLRLDDIQ